MSRFNQQRITSGGYREPENGGLATRLRARDPQVMAEVYEQYGRLIFSIIFSIVHDRPRAEDLTQETFVRVWNRSHEFDGGSEHIGKWVVAIARNRAIDDIRSLSSRMSRKTSHIDEHPGTAPSADLEREVEDADDARMIRGALSRLEANHRKVLQLAYYEGLSQTEIASRLGQPLGTVKSWCRVALRHLREHVDAGATHSEMRAN